MNRIVTGLVFSFSYNVERGKKIRLIEISIIGIIVGTDNMQVSLLLQTNFKYISHFYNKLKYIFVYL